MKADMNEHVPRPADTVLSFLSFLAGSASVSPSSSLSGPREWCADAVLDWLGAFWLVASLESLVHCCLLESLGSQRRASLLENKSKWDFFSSYGGGGGVFNFLAA